MQKNKNSRKNLLSVVISLSFIFFFDLIPAPTGLSKLSMQILGIFVGTVILWLTVSIDWPSILCIAAIGMTGLMSMNSILSSFFGNSTVLFLVFSYMLAFALGESGILKRFAVWFISRRITNNHPWILVLMLLIAAMLIGLVIIPSTMILIFIPIMTAMFRQCKLKEGDQLPEAIMLMVAFTGSIAQGMTPIGHAHPVIAMSILSEITGYEIPYAKFMFFAIPNGIIVFILMILFFRFIVKIDPEPFRNVESKSIQKELGPMTKQEKIVLSVFLLVVFCWLAPSILKPFSSDAATFFNKLGNVYPPLVGVILLCIINVEGKPLCNFKEATSRGIPWGIVFLVGATVVMSSALTNEDVGISAWVGEIISTIAENLSPFVFSLFIIAAAVILTNFSSNAVTATLITSISIPIALIMPDKINPYAMAAVIGSAVNYAFATPLATAVVAIAAGTGWVNSKNMAKYGAVVGAIAILVFALIGYPLANNILPYSA